MPVGKYHCDYCEKEFQDTPAARRRHLEGLHHRKAKALWYDSLHLQDQGYSYNVVLQKGVCNRFVKSGFCHYGDSCKYIHPRQNFHNSSTQGEPIKDAMGMSWANNLPPSLQPPPEGGYPPLPLVDWG